MDFDAQTPVSNPSKLLPLAIISLVVVLSLGTLFYIFHTHIQNKLTRESVIQVEARPFTPEGTIYLTLAERYSSTTGVYAYNTANATLEAFFSPSGVISVTPRYKDATTMLFSTNVNTSNMQIAALNTATMQISQLTHSTTVLKRHPSYSQKYNEVIFGAKAVNTGKLGTPDEFKVYATDAKGVEKEITQGALPTLTPDGSAVVVLRKDGLYLHDLAGTSTEKIWALDLGSAWFNLQFAVSPKGKYIAWSMPYEGYVYVMRVGSWSPFQGEVAFKIPTHAFWPVFSPNEEYLAYEEIDWNKIDSKPRLVIADLLTPQRKVVQDLNAFDQQRMFITDWK